MLTSYLKFCLNRALYGALFLVLLTFAGSVSHAAPRPADNIDSPKALQSWENLLFYSNRWLGKATSLVDSPDFFLAPEGSHDPLAERDAFITALLNDSMAVEEAKRVACRFPARKAWVKAFRPALILPEIDCPEYNSWLMISQPQGLSIVFSSYFVNNPSSMMGHTFLRIARTKAKASPLLDQSVNFAASPTHEIPILYSIDGLTGGFPGTFSMMPYYLKVQEYANAESRDLWEYDLSLSETETLAVMASLWELAPARIDYYFFDENCSAVLLYLIQNARPQLRLTHKLGTWVHPSDTLRYLMEEPGLVQDIVYRPSSRSRYLAQRAALDSSEVAVMKRVIATQSLEGSPVGFLSPARQAAILDAIIAFIEFDEGLHGTKPSTKHARLYDAVLSTRAKLVQSPLVTFPKPESEAPHLGHKGRRLGLGLASFAERGELQLDYRPGQHDLLSPAMGYPPELSIQLGRTRLALEDKDKIRLRSLDVFHIQSFNPTRSGRLPWSWQLQLNFESTAAERFQFFGSLGQAQSLGSREEFVFFLFDTRFMLEEGKFWTCPGVSSGGRFAVGKTLVSFTEVGVEKCYSERTRAWEGRWSQEFRYALDSVYELSISARKYRDAKEFMLGAYRYY